MKYFSKKFLRSSDLKVLRKGLLETRSHRIVDYGGNWLQVSHHDKLVHIKGQGDLWIEYERLVERCKDVWIDFESNPPCPFNYDWSSLSPAFKRYMREQDEIQYHVYYSRLFKGQSTEDYNRRLDKLEKYMESYNDDDFRKYVLLGYPIPTPNYKKALDSARRAYNQVNGLLKSNINEFTEFLTFTFAQERRKQRHVELGAEFEYIDGTDFKIAKEAFTAFMNKLQMRAKARGYTIKYICVWELQGNGNYHFHVVCNTISEDEKIKNPDWLDYDTIAKKFENSTGLQSWKHGKSDVQKISSHEKISTYLSKYILKSMYNIADNEDLLERYKGQKKYFTSRGLKKPEVKYEDDFDENYDIKPYETEHINPYNNGLIKNKIYTFIDKNEKDTASETVSTEKFTV